MNPPGLLLIRADASAVIGTGHVMRSLALAQAWQDAGGRVRLATASIPAALADRLRRENMVIDLINAERGSAADLAATVALAGRHDAHWVVLDGYCFDGSFVDVLQAAGRRVLMLDDMVHLNRYPAELLLNQNLSAEPALYAGKVGQGTALLLGPRYSLLRREFRQVPARQPASAGANLRVLVSFGGGDAENYSGAVLRNLAASGRRSLEVVVLAGAANPHVPDLRQLAATVPFPCTIRVNEENVAAVMAASDVAITAAGSTVWELAALQLPALIGAHEDNQLAGLAALQAVPFFRARTIAGLLATNLADELAAVSALRGPAPGCDALGAGRVVAALQSAVRPALLSA